AHRVHWADALRAVLPGEPVVGGPRDRVQSLTGAPASSQAHVVLNESDLACYWLESRACTAASARRPMRRSRSRNLGSDRSASQRSSTLRYISPPSRSRNALFSQSKALSGSPTMRRVESNRSRIPSARKCYLCARNKLLPM